MKDAVFAGSDLPAALAAASRDLGLPAEALRYVVLDPGSEDAPAQIAVLLDASAAAAAGPSQAAPPQQAGAAASAVVRELIRAAELDVQVALEEGEHEITVRIDGPDREFFIADDGLVLQALEHVLQRAVSARQERRRVGLDLPGYHDPRDERLRERAREIARAVLDDGVPRTTDPLNSYERRVVHMAVAELEGLKTESVGAAGDRKVSISPATTD